jgi:[acyl-carrier-protein] S-malonyltransferase
VALAQAAGARRALRLNVSGAFHSPLMASAEAGLAAQLAGIGFGEPAYPVVSNVTAEPVREAEDARTLLVRQLTAPVRWSAGVRTMRREGVTRFLELGPGAVLVGLLRRIDREAEAASLGTAAEVEAFLHG